MSYKRIGKLRIASKKAELRRRATKAELQMFDLLSASGLPFKFQKAFVGRGRVCIADFYLPSPFLVVIEVDGGYHFEEPQISKDAARDRYIRETRRRGLIRVRNESVPGMSVDELLGMVAKEVEVHPRNGTKKKAALRFIENLRTAAATDTLVDA